MFENKKQIGKKKALLKKLQAKIWTSSVLSFGDHSVSSNQVL
jgi:hypothetical protein